MAQFPVVRC